MAQFMKYPFFLKGLIKKYLNKKYSKEESAKIWDKILEIYKDFVEEAPDIGGKENNMSSNLYMALGIFAFYEAIDKKITIAEIEEIMQGALPKTIPIFSAVTDLNKPKNQEKLRVRFEKYKALSDEKLDNGEWGNNWRVELNPHNRKKGVAFDLVGCPLVDFAKKHGYNDIMPVLCKFDYITAGLMHAKLIREHTVAEGSEYCDYWYIGDKDTEN